MFLYFRPVTPGEWTVIAWVFGSLFVLGGAVGLVVSLVRTDLDFLKTSVFTLLLGIAIFFVAYFKGVKFKD